MSEPSFVVQKVEWFQFRDTAGHAFFVMVSSLPNGFFTAVPCQPTMQRADHIHGVTMERPGISRLISLAIPRAA